MCWCADRVFFPDVAADCSGMLLDKGATIETDRDAQALHSFRYGIVTEMPGVLTIFKLHAANRRAIMQLRKDAALL
jgi:hypothetical protein